MVLKEFIENEDPDVRVKYMGQNGLDITNKVVMHDSDEEDDFDIGHGASGKSRGGKGRKKDDASDDDYDINFIDL